MAVSRKTVLLKVRSDRSSCLHRGSQIVCLSEVVTDVVIDYVHTDVVVDYVRTRFSCLWITIAPLLMNPPFFQFWC